MASGTGGQIAFHGAGSLFQEVNSAIFWTNFKSESIEHTLEELEEGSITGHRDAPPSHKGIDFGQGDIVAEPNPNALGLFLNYALGSRTSSLVTAAGSTGANSGFEAGKPQFHHTYTPRASAYSDRVFLAPLAAMVYKDVGSAFMFDGAIFTGLEFQMQAGQLAEMTANVMARKVRRIERIAGITSLVSSGGRPWVWDMASLEIGTSTASSTLVAKTNYESITIGLTTPHEGVVLLDGTKNYGEMQMNDFRRVAISGTISFRDQTEYNAFTAYEARRMRLTFLNVNSNLALGNTASLDATAFLGYYGMRIHIPRMKLLSWSTPVQGPNRLVTNFTAKAERDPNENNDLIKIELLNVVSGATYDLTA
jgi:hypothetical protein